jgi:membrane-associated phospholipid phosphatase
MQLQTEPPSQNTRAVISRLVLPVAAVILLSIAAALHLGANPDRTGKSFFEVLGHHLGHEINTIWVAIGGVLLVLPLGARTKWDRIVWPLRLAEAVVLNFVLTDAFFRRVTPWPRPNDPDHPGFPSGHSQFAFIMAWLVWSKYPRLGPVWFACAAIIGWSRVVVNAHFPYQVICGAIIGCFVAWTVVDLPKGLFLTRIFRPKETPPGAEA